jgi:hypothetical protein
MRDELGIFITKPVDKMTLVEKADYYNLREDFLINQEYEKKRLTKKLKKEFPTGISLLNVLDCKWYCFNTDNKGKIEYGIFWSYFEDALNEETEYIYNREDKILYKRK